MLNDFLFYLLSFLIVYLIGSISPGYFLGKIVKGIDIRRFGNGNTGATNTYNLVGPLYGVVAGVFDFIKAAAVYLVFLRAGFSPEVSSFAGLAAVIGHIFPFYLGWRGGRGVASLAGLAIAIVSQSRTWFSLVFAGSSLIYMAAVSERLRSTLSLRRVLKLGALILPFGFIEISDIAFLYVATTLFLIAVGFDAARFFSSRINNWYLANEKISKPKETKRLSGYSIFLFSVVMLFLFFPKPIVLIALNFFIIGDMVGPIAGKLFLRTEIVNKKTWGGAIGIFIACLLAGLFMRVLAPFEVGWPMILAGAFSATVLDQLSFLLDDNLLVPLGTALILTVIT